MAGERDQMPDSPDSSAYFGEDSIFDSADTPSEPTPSSRTTRPESGPATPVTPAGPEPTIEPSYAQVSEQVRILQRQLHGFTPGTPHHTQVQNRLLEFSARRQRLIDQARGLNLLDEVNHLAQDARNTIAARPGVADIAREYADSLFNSESEVGLPSELRGFRRAYLEEQLQQVEADRQREVETERVATEATEATRRAQEEEARRVEEARRQSAPVNREQEYRQFGRTIVDETLPDEVRNEALFKAIQLVEQFLRPTAGGVTETMTEAYDKGKYGELSNAIATGFEDPRLDALKKDLLEKLEARFNYHNLWVAGKKRDEASYAELFLSMHGGNHDYIQGIQGVREFQYALRQDNGAFFRSEGGRNININTSVGLTNVENRVRQQVRDPNDTLRFEPAADYTKNRLDEALSGILGIPLAVVQALSVDEFNARILALPSAQSEQYNRVFDQLEQNDNRIKHEIWLLRQKVRVADLFQGTGKEEDPLDGEAISSEGLGRAALELRFIDIDADYLAKATGASAMQIKSLSPQDRRDLVAGLNPTQQSNYQRLINGTHGLTANERAALFGNLEERKDLEKLYSEVERRFVISQMNYSFTGLAARYDGPRWSREYHDAAQAGQPIELPIELRTGTRNSRGEEIVIDLTHPPLSASEARVMIEDINNDPYLTPTEKRDQINEINDDIANRGDERVRLQWVRKNKPELLSQAQDAAWRNFFRDHFDDIDFTNSCTGAGSEGLGRLIYNPIWREKVAGQDRGIADELRQYTSLQIQDFLSMDGYSSLIDMNANFDNDFVKRNTYAAKFGMAKKLEGVMGSLLSDEAAINDAGFDVIKKLQEPQGPVGKEEALDFSTYWVSALVDFRKHFNEKYFRDKGYRNISSAQADYQIRSAVGKGYLTKPDENRVRSEVLNPFERTIGIQLGGMDWGGAIGAMIGKFLSLIIGGK